jgi:hypothetical protein
MIKISKLAGLVATSIALAPHVASAMPIAPQNKCARYGRSRGNFTETVQWRICRAVRHEARFGWRWRYFRCVARRGCA